MAREEKRVRGGVAILIAFPPRGWGLTPRRDRRGHSRAALPLDAWSFEIWSGRPRDYHNRYSQSCQQW